MQPHQISPNFPLDKDVRRHGVPRLSYSRANSASILEGEMQTDPTLRLDMPDRDCYVFCEKDGLNEPKVDLGNPVSAGDFMARVWPLDRTGVEPITHCARI